MILKSIFEKKIKCFVKNHFEKSIKLFIGLKNHL